MTLDLIMILYINHFGDPLPTINSKVEKTRWRCGYSLLEGKECIRLVPSFSWSWLTVETFVFVCKFFLAV